MASYIKRHWKGLIALAVIILVILYRNSPLIMLNLPTGHYMESIDSPNGEYTMKSYRYSGGATVDWSCRVEIIYKKVDKKVNIYWKYHEKDVKMKWLDNDTVEVNNIKLNIHKDYYYKNS